MARMYVRKWSGTIYSLDGLPEAVSDVKNQNITSSEVFTLKVALKSFKISQETRTNKGTKNNRGESFDQNNNGGFSLKKNYKFMKRKNEREQTWMGGINIEATRKNCQCRIWKSMVKYRGSFKETQ